MHDRCPGREKSKHELNFISNFFDRQSQFLIISAASNWSLYLDYDFIRYRLHIRFDSWNSSISYF
jgi:hypothetical protein